MRLCTHTAFSHKIQPLFKYFLHPKICVDSYCFYYFDQGRRSCPGASCLIINEMKVLTSSCECQPDVKSTNSVVDIQRVNNASVTSSSKMASEELESANCSGSTLIHEVIDKSQKNVA